MFSDREMVIEVNREVMEEALQWQIPKNYNDRVVGLVMNSDRRRNF